MQTGRALQYGERVCSGGRPPDPSYWHPETWTVGLMPLRSSSDWKLEECESVLSSRRSNSCIRQRWPTPLCSRHTSARWPWAFIILTGTVLVPLQVTCLWPVAVLSTIGHSVHPTKPAKSWRRNLTLPALKFLFSAGFLVKVKRKKATRDEAPIFVTAPHSTFF